MTSSAETILFSNDQYVIRPAKNHDEYRGMWWRFMRELGWDRGYYDLETYMNPSIGYGMILLIEKASGKPVGHIAAVINANSTGWIAMFIVEEAHRGKGMGGELFKAAMADFERNGTKIKGLDGVPQQRATYQRRGFVESSLGEIPLMIRNLIAKDPLPMPQHDGYVIDLRKVSQRLLVQHELETIGFERPKLWTDENLFNRPDVKGVALVTKKDPKNIDDIHGWAMIRRCSNGVRLGPVYASDAPSAKVILASVLQLATPQYIKSIPLPDEPMNDWSDEQIGNDATVVVETWGGNAESVGVFEACGWQSVPDGFSVAHRMWVDGEATPQLSKGGLAQKRVFAVFDAAVG